MKTGQEEVSVNEISSQIRHFLATQVLFQADPASLTADTELIGRLVDSLGLMQLVAYVEEQYAVVFEDAEVTADNFRTLGDMERLVIDKVAAARIA
jgi:acyl carrier protein